MTAINDSAVEINVIKDKHNTAKEQALGIKSLISKTKSLPFRETTIAYAKERGQPQADKGSMTEQYRITNRSMDDFGWELLAEDKSRFLYLRRHR